MEGGAGGNNDHNMYSRQGNLKKNENTLWSEGEHRHKYTDFGESGNRFLQFLHCWMS